MDLARGFAGLFKRFGHERIPSLFSWLFTDLKIARLIQLNKKLLFSVDIIFAQFSAYK